MSVSKILTVALCILIYLIATSSGQFINIRKFHSPGISDGVTSKIITVNVRPMEDVSPIIKSLRSGKTLSDTTETKIIVVKPLRNAATPSDKKIEHRFLDKTPKLTNLKDPQKTLKFIFDDNEAYKSSSGATREVHLASGAYPVFYGLAKINGKFKGNPIITLDVTEDTKRPKIIEDNINF